MQSRKFVLALAALTLVLTAACTTRTPAPVVERNASPTLAAPEIRMAPPVSVTPINPNAPGNTAGSQFHVVQKGETLYGIARLNGLDVNAFTAWNNIVAGQTLREGQVLRLSPPLGSAPAMTSPGTVVTAIPATGAIQGQPLAPGVAPSGVPASPSLAPMVVPVEAPLKREPRSQRLPYSDAALAAMQRGEPGAAVAPDSRAVAPASVASSPTSPVVVNPATPPAVASVIDAEIKPGSGVDRDGISWTWPTSGKVASKFNEKAPRKGIDIAANTGSAIVAAASGMVIYVGKELRGYGQMVVIKHAKETVSIYADVDKIQVKEKQQVLLGQKLAEVADGAGNKIHFEVRRQGRPLDPLALMPQ